MNIGYLDVFRVGHSHDALANTKLGEQGAMHGGEDGSTLDGGADDGAIGQAIGHLGILGHQEVAVERLARLPGVADGDIGIALLLDDGEQRGVLQLQGVALLLMRNSVATPTTGQGDNN